MGATVFPVILGILIFGLIAVYNRLVKLKNRFRNSFAQIDVQLKRRYDLIPNLVEVAKGYLQHERQTLEAVIAATAAPGGSLHSRPHAPVSRSIWNLQGEHREAGQSRPPDQSL